MNRLLHFLQAKLQLAIIPPIFEAKSIVAVILARSIGVFVYVE